MSDNALAGTSWLVQEIGGVVTTPPKPEVSFGDDGRLSGTTGVNRVMGGYEVPDDGTLRFDNAATTRMAGPPEGMAQEQALLALITGDQPFGLSGDRLLIGAPGGAQLLLVRPSVQPVPDDSQTAQATEAG